MDTFKSKQQTELIMVQLNFIFIEEIIFLDKFGREG